MPASRGRAIQPSSSARSSSIRRALRAAVDLRGQIVAPFDFDALIQRVRPGGGQALDGVSQELPRGRSLGRCQ